MMLQSSGTINIGASKKSHFVGIPSANADSSVRLTDVCNELADLETLETSEPEETEVSDQSEVDALKKVEELLK